MKYALLTMLALLLLLPAAAMAGVTLKPSNQYSDTVWYEGGTNTQNQAWKTASISLVADVSDTNLMAFQIHIRYPSTKIAPFTDSVVVGTMLTENNADSYFFNVSIETNTTSGTLTITGSRMDATAGEKARSGNGLSLATNIRFYRVSTASLYGDSLCVMSGFLKFRDASNGSISTVSVQSSGWNFQAKPYMTDVNLSGSVSLADVAATRNGLGSGNVTYDVNESGGISLADVARVRSELGSNY